MEKKQILLAFSPEGEERLREALGSQFPLISCFTFPSAVRTLSQRHEQIGLILCGLRFDDSKMFDLLRHVKTDNMLESIPFVCMRATTGLFDTHMNSEIYDGLEMVTQDLGAKGFIDLTRLEEEYGKQEAHNKLRSKIRSLF